MPLPRHATRRPITPDDEAQIARFIAERGVTICPTVALAPTTAEISAEDTIALIIHHTRQYDAYMAEQRPRVARAAAASFETSASRRRCA